ncbi:hypothetical protein, partial [Halomonas alkalisoli]|uniref:hypothetical protein n=1 Tax=Halomonas alkalisoli TaxID=2907158 RepID=UPI001F24B807
FSCRDKRLPPCRSIFRSRLEAEGLPAVLPMPATTASVAASAKAPAGASRDAEQRSNSDFFLP